MHFIDPKIQQFLKGLGYQGLGGGTGSFGPAIAFGVMGGAVEHARMSTVGVSPEFGSTIRGLNRMLTDLPLEPTKPIDSGILNFCTNCKICANECPFGALSLGEREWEGPIPAYNPGFKGYRVDYHKCPFCGACMAMCPFNSIEHSFVHDLVKSTVSTTSIFNGFFANMHSLFDYGFKDPETWWDMADEPTYGLAKPLL
jgi:reductive dehalogenase